MQDPKNQQRVLSYQKEALGVLQNQENLLKSVNSTLENISVALDNYFNEMRYGDLSPLKAVDKYIQASSDRASVKSSLESDIRAYSSMSATEKASEAGQALLQNIVNETNNFVTYDRTMLENAKLSMSEQDYMQLWSSDMNYIKWLKATLKGLGVEVPEFATGGFTSGGVSDVAGIVHGGEWVANASFVGSNRAFFESLESLQRSGRYADISRPVNNVIVSSKDNDAEVKELLREIRNEIKKDRNVIVNIKAELDALKIKKALDKEHNLAV